MVDGVSGKADYDISFPSPTPPTQDDPAVPKAVFQRLDSFASVAQIVR